MIGATWDCFGGTEESPLLTIGVSRATTTGAEPLREHCTAAKGTRLLVRGDSFAASEAELETRTEGGSVL